MKRQDREPLGIRPGEVVLYLSEFNAQKGGQKAFELLEQAHLPFHVVSSEFRLPAAEFGGLMFRGVTGVKRLAETLQSARDVFISEARRSLPELFQNPDQNLIAKMKTEGELRLEATRAELKRLQTSRTP